MVSDGKTKDRVFANNAQGTVLAVTRGIESGTLIGDVRPTLNNQSTTATQYQFVANGEVLGRYGQLVDKQKTTDPAKPVYKRDANFNFGYQAVGTTYPANTPVTWVVQAGDTLQSIAKAVYGDASQWYLVADANGLSDSSELRQGASLTIPSRVGGANNNSGTFKPYDPSAIIGDTTPVLPMPTGDGGRGCGGIGAIITAVVSVVVAIYAPYMLGLVTKAGAITIGGGLVGGALGSIAGQVVGNALGVVDGFSWKQVGLSAIAGGIGAGLQGADILGKVGVTGGASSFGNVVARASVGNALSQGIGVATGLQSSFSWKGVAASAVGAGVGSIASEGLGLTEFNGKPTNAYSGFEKFGRATLAGFAAGTAAAVTRGGKVAVQQVAIDAFGNALGSSLADSGGTRNPSSVDYENEMDRASDKYQPPADDAQRVNGLTFSQDSAMREAANNPYGLPTRSSGTVVRDFDPKEQWSGELVPVGQDGAFTADVAEKYRSVNSSKAASSPAPVLTASDWRQQAESLNKQATMLSDAAIWAKAQGMESAAIEYQLKATQAYYKGQSASTQALSMTAESQGSVPQAKLQFSPASGWSYMGQNSVGYVQGRGIFPDYQSFGVGAHTFSGSVATNLYDGTNFYGGGVSASNVNPEFTPSAAYSLGWIFGVNNSDGVNDFLGGSGTQIGVVIPTPWRVSASVVVNHSYGGATSVELGVGPRVDNKIFVYQPYGYSEKVGK